jgi:hypothetical protein
MAAALLAGLVTGANASDTLFQQFTGDYGVATSGWGLLADSGTMSVSIPVGATVTGAWLYQSTYNLGDSPTAPGGTFGGSDVNYSTTLGVNSSAGGNLQAYRGDVTSTVAAAVDGGPGGSYNFSVSETDTTEQDGRSPCRCLFTRVHRDKHGCDSEWSRVLGRGREPCEFRPAARSEYAWILCSHGDRRRL